MLDVEDEFFRVLKYLNEEDFYCSKELWKLTNGFSDIDVLVKRLFKNPDRVFKQPY